MVREAFSEAGPSRLFGTEVKNFDVGNIFPYTV